MYPAPPAIRSPSACLWWMWAGSGVHTPCLTHHLHQDYSSQSGFNALDCRRIKLSRYSWIVYLNSFSNVTSWCLKDHPNVSMSEVILSILTKNHLNWLCIWELNAECAVLPYKGRICLQWWRQVSSAESWVTLLEWSLVQSPEQACRLDERAGLLPNLPSSLIAVSSNCQEDVRSLNL